MGFAFTLLRNAALAWICEVLQGEKNSARFELPLFFGFYD
jgi:hypothetical protein